MAGFFGMNNYAKAGPGISKDEREKHSFFNFFDIYFRKFFKLMQINMIFFITCLPFFIPYIFINILAGKYILPVYLSMIPFIGVAVMVSGFTYIMRNFAREDYAFVWLDYKDTIKSNWRQSLAIGTIDFFVFSICYFLIRFYDSQLKVHSFFVIPLILCFFIAVIFLFMQYYIFVMLITFNLSIKQLLKNALIFSIAGLTRNLVITLFSGLLIYLVYELPIACVFVPFILLSTIGLIINFGVWPLIKRVMIPEDDEGNNKNSIFEDNGNER